MKKYLPLAIVLAAAVAMPAMANQKSGYKNKPYNLRTTYFQQMDLNKDGVISREEHDVFSDATFSNADANRDGVLSRNELKAFKTRGYAYTTQGSPYQNEKESTGGIAGNDLQPSAGNPQYPSGTSDYPSARSEYPTGYNYRHY